MGTAPEEGVGEDSLVRVAGSIPGDREEGLEKGQPEGGQRGEWTVDAAGSDGFEGRMVSVT